MLISQKAASIAAYVAGEQPQGGGWIKLNTNENPYPSADFSIPFDRERLRLYPDPTSTELRSEIASLHGVGVENVFVGNGSDEVLAIAFQALFDAESKPVAAPDVTYSFYPVYAALYGINYRTVPLREDFSIAAEDYSGDYGGIIIANPNAPTAMDMGRESILKLVAAHSNIPVVIDEAYVDFGGESVADAVKDHRNLVVTRTLSKSYSLAGLRVGYALGSPELMCALEKIKNCFNSYTLDTVSQAIATNAIRRQDVMRANVERVVQTRARTVAALKAMNFTVLESSANFVFARPVGMSGKDVFDALKARKILVRRWNAPRIGDYLRITIGTDEDMDAVLTALREILQ